VVENHLRFADPESVQSQGRATSGQYRSLVRVLTLSRHWGVDNVSRGPDIAKCDFYCKQWMHGILICGVSHINKEIIYTRVLQSSARRKLVPTPNRNRLEIHNLSTSAPRTPEVIAPKPPIVNKPQLAAPASGFSGASSSPLVTSRDD
jgi:hypothetical protein